MSEAFFVRIRGRVHGPIDRSKLDRLVAKGQLSRIHEISNDGQSWQPASSMPELFVAPVIGSPVANAKLGAARSGQGADSRSTAMATDGWPASSNRDTGFEPTQDPWQTDGVGGEEESASWYYAVDGSQHGPVSLAKIAELIRTKTVSQRDMVWTNDMTNWAEAESVSALKPFFSANHQAAHPKANPSANPYAISSESPIIAGGGGFEDVVNFELQQWIGPVTWVRNAAFLVGLMTIGAGVLCILSCLFLFLVSQLVIGVVNMVLGGLIIWFATTLVALKRDLVIAGELRNGESIASAIRSAVPTWKTLLWNLLGTIVAFGIFFVVGFVMAATGGF